MPEEFSEISRKSVWALVQDISEIGEALRKELPYDSVTPSWNNEDGTDKFTIGICGRIGKTHHFLNIYTHYFDAPPEPKEMYPQNCCAIGTLEISSSEPVPRQSFEVCGTSERWMVQLNDKWVPLTASLIAFLMGRILRPADSQ